MRKKGFIGAIVLGIIIFGTIILALLCTTRVPAGYVAVQYSMNGGVKNEVLTQGWHVVSPTIKTTLYTVGIEQSYGRWKERCVVNIVGASLTNGLIQSLHLNGRKVLFDGRRTVARSNSTKHLSNNIKISAESTK